MEDLKWQPFWPVHEMKKNIQKDIFWVALGGAIGASMRYGTNLVIPQIFPEHPFLTATVVENMLGCFLIGVLFTILTKQTDFDRNLKLFLLTGITGSYTTYSGFMIEALELFNHSIEWYIAYMFGQVLAGLIFVGVGIKAAQKINPASRL